MEPTDRDAALDALWMAVEELLAAHCYALPDDAAEAFVNSLTRRSFHVSLETHQQMQRLLIKARARP
jgi:hypothetical protein